MEKIDQRQAGWLQMLEWPIKVVSEFRPNAPQPQFTSQDQYRITKALCVLNVGPEACDPRQNLYANSLLALFRDIAPASYPVRDLTDGQPATGFLWNGNDYHLLCSAGMCALQKQVPVEKSEWEQFLTGGLLFACSPAPQETKSKDVMSFNDASSDLLPQFNETTFFNYDSLCTSSSASWVKLLDASPAGKVVVTQRSPGSLLVINNSTFTAIDFFGKILWGKTYPQIIAAPLAVQHFPNSGFVVSGRPPEVQHDGISDMSVLLRLSDDGEIVWKSDFDPTHGDDNQLTVTQIVAAESSSYFLTAEYWERGSKNPLISITKRNTADGSEVWKTNVYQDSWTAFPVGMWQASDNSYVLVVGHAGENGTDSILTVFYSSGIIKSKKVLNQLLDVDYAHGLIDGDFIIEGNTPPLDSDSIMRLSLNGDVVWKKNLGKTNPGMYTWTSLAQLANKSIAVAGSDWSSFPPQISMDIYSVDGSLLSSHVYTNSGASVTSNITSLFDGGAVLVGSIDKAPSIKSSSKNAIIIKTDPLGNVCK